MPSLFLNNFIKNETCNDQKMNNFFCIFIFVNTAVRLNLENLISTIKK